MDQRLHDILLETAVRSGQGEGYTHVSLYGPFDYWNLKASSYTDFWLRYTELAAMGVGDLCIAERIPETLPVIADFIMRYREDGGHYEPYDGDFLKSLALLFQNVITEMFHLQQGSPETVCCVLETESWSEIGPGGEEQTLSKIRLQFPFCVVDLPFQRGPFREAVLAELYRQNVLGELQRQPIGTWEEIFTPRTLLDPVVMYGSREAPHVPALTLSYRWHFIDPEIPADEIPSFPLESFVKAENHTHVQSNRIEYGRIRDLDPHYLLPLFLSVHHWGQVARPKEIHVNNTPIQGPSRPFGSGHTGPEQTTTEMMHNFLSMISYRRYLEESSCNDIGKALYQIANRESDDLMLGRRWWIQAIKKALGEIPKEERVTNADFVDGIPNFLTRFPSLDDYCTAKYPTFNRSGNSIKTLAYFAREDNRAKYDAWHKPWCLVAMEQAIRGADDDVTKAVYRCYWLDYVCADTVKKIWYRFDRHRWSQSNGGVELRTKISGDFLERFLKIRAVLARQIHESHDESFRTTAEVTMKRLVNLIDLLKSVRVKNKVMVNAMEYFYEERFLELLDSNTDLTGMLNGVIEVTSDRAIFRPGRPDDFISRCTGIAYDPDLSEKSDSVRRMLKWLHQMFPDEKLFAHMVKFAASVLRGGNPDKIFGIFTGEGGDNSKSSFVRLFEMTLGPYCIKFPMSLITGKRTASSAPTPELARAKSAKIAFLDEAGDDEQIGKEKVKGFTGGDSFFARLLHDNGGDVKATFKMILVCNQVPVIPNPDKATKNRTNLFPFLSTWVHNAPDTEEEQFRQRLFPMDPFFERHMPALAPAFMWLLVQWYPRYVQEGLNKKPEIVEQATQDYWKENDIYLQFTAECIQSVRDSTGTPNTNMKLTQVEVYEAFNGWYRDVFPGSAPPNRATVIKQLSRSWGPPKLGIWYAIALVRKAATIDPLGAPIPTFKPQGATLARPPQQQTALA